MPFLKETKTNSLICLMSDVLILPSINLTPLFTRTQGQKENTLEGQMHQRGVFNGLEMRLCQLVLHQGKVPGRHTPPTFGSVSVKSIQEMNEILIFADIYGRIPQFVSNG